MPENRTKTGQFAKGCSGNPGGRPPMTTDQKQQLEALRGLTAQAVGVLTDLLTDDAAPPAVRLKAAESVLDRVYGHGVKVSDAMQDEKWADRFGGLLL